MSLAAAMAFAALVQGRGLELQDRISVGQFYSPHRTAISSETWVTYEIAEGYGIGVAYVWESRRVRPVSSVRFIDETAWHPGFRFQSGFRSVAHGATTDSLTIDKSFGRLSLEGGFSRGGGLTRGIAKVSYLIQRGLSVGLQADGRNVITYVNFTRGAPTIGAYLVNGKHPAYMFAWKF